MTASYNDIVVKLEHFIRKFYKNELLRGGILFLFFGLLYFLLVTGLEYFFWFGSGVRRILFGLFLVIELILFGRFICWPIFKLIKLARGIDYYQAAHLIGKHFPEVNDQLINMLQLKKMSLQHTESDLLAASIDQKAKELRPVPFERAIRFSTSFKYLKFLAVPVLFIVMLWVFGKSDWYRLGYERLSNYNQAYQPPAPFYFRILNESLIVDEGSSLSVQVGTVGEIVPGEVHIITDQGTFLLHTGENQIFTYRFENLERSFSFILKANGIQSDTYKVKVVKIPKIQDLKMDIKYPAYLQKASKSYEGLQNIRVPEGSVVNWEILGNHVEQIKIKLESDSIYNFKRENNHFEWSQPVMESMRYELTSSNQQRSNYERLQARIDVIKDEFPEIFLESKQDSSRGLNLFFKGQAMDDYGITALYLRYYKKENEDHKKTVKIPVSPSNFMEFYAAFPDTIQLEKGESYELYFEVYDNDGVHGPKRTRSKKFSIYEKTDKERAQERLESSKRNISDFENYLGDFRENNDRINKFKLERIEKGESDYKLRNSLKDFLIREKKGIENAKTLAEELERNLEKAENSSTENDNLKKRLEKNRDNLSKNEELLRELEKYSKELSNDKLNEKLDYYNRQRKNQFRSLESLLELTKRLYVKQKSRQLTEDLEELTERQHKLIESSDSESENQKEVNDDFEKWKSDFSNLEKENQNLRNPRNLSRDENAEKQITDSLKEAYEQLEEAEEVKKEDQQKAKDLEKKGKQKQEEGGDRMKNLLENMQLNLEEMDMKQLQEDAGMLRRILSNLLSFSFDQEDLMEQVRGITKDHPGLGRYIRHQQHLKDNFKHVDDSLYALALRNPVISDDIFEEITTVDYNMEVVLENLAKGGLYKGVSSQRFIISSSNELANLLDDALQNMEMQMESMGSGQGSMPLSQPNDGNGEFQLEDIIKAQEGLLQELKEESEKGKEGENGDEGNQRNGENGEQDGPGKEGKGEKNFEEIFEIYKRQAELREKMNALLDRLQEGHKDYDPLRKDMEKMEEDILKGSSDKQSQQRMQHIIKRMLRLQEALYDKEKDGKREAETNTQQVERNTLHYKEEMKKMFGSEEILNRQALPLQNLYKRLIKDYFQDHD